MLSKKTIALFKGVHPGIYLGRKLKRMRISQISLAREIGIHPQTLNAVIKGKRDMNIPLSLKIESYFDWEEGLLMLLQVYYDIAQEKKKHKKKPNLSIFRPALFWDTNIATIDWQKSKKVVIHRVFSRGNKLEQNSIEQFYGTTETQRIIQSFKWQENV